MAAKPSDSSRNQAGLEVITRALPFETIPDEPLRAHFARWLIDSLTDKAPPRPIPVPEPEKIPPAPMPDSGSPAPVPPPRADARLPASTPETTTHPTVRTSGVDTYTPASTAAAATRLPESAALSEIPSEAALPDDPLGADPLLLEWQGPPAPPRPQFVRQRDGKVWVTKPILRSRGWTDAAVRDFLPEPEGLKPNPRFAVIGSPMPVWRPATVAAAEASPEWQGWLERSLRRRRTTLEALAESEDDEFRARLDAARMAIESERGGIREPAAGS